MFARVFYFEIILKLVYIDVHVFVRFVIVLVKKNYKTFIIVIVMKVLFHIFYCSKRYCQGVFYIDIPIFIIMVMVIVLHISKHTLY